MKTSQNYGRKRIEPVLLESLDDLTTEKVPRARIHVPGRPHCRSIPWIPGSPEKNEKISSPFLRDEKPKIISLSETLLKAKLFYEKEFLNVKKWKRFPELNRLLGGFR